MSDELTAGPVAELDGLTKQVNAEESTDAAAPKAGEVEPQATANEGDNPNDTPDQEQKRLGGWQRKILKEQKEKEQVAQERDFWKQEALKQRAPESTENSAATTPANRPKPTEFDTKPDGTLKYASYTDLLEDLADWKTEQRFAAYERQQQQRLATERWQEQRTKAAEKHADYQDAEAMAVKTMQQHQGDVMTAVANALRANDAGTDVLYYLGQHPEEVSSLSRLDPYSAVMELGALKKAIAKDDPAKEEDKPLAVAQSRAPKPPTPVQKASAADTGLRDDLPFKEWVKRREAQLQGK